MRNVPETERSVRTDEEKIGHGGEYWHEDHSGEDHVLEEPATENTELH